MGKGLDLARPEAPEHVALIEEFKEQLLIALVRRLGGNVSIAATEVDETGRYVLAFSLHERTFHFELRKKQ